MTKSALAEHASDTSAQDDAAAPAVENPSPPGTRPQFTITEAATACAVSRKTITRKLPELSTYGAAKDGEGVWRIPVEALLAAGLHPGRSLPSQSATKPVPAPARGSTPGASTPAVTRATQAAPSAPTTVVAPDADLVTISRQRWDDLRIRLARAEAEASERSLALADARLALRALTAGPAVAPMSRAGHPTQVGQTPPLSLGQAPGTGQQDAVAQGHPRQTGDVVTRRRWWRWS